MFLSRDVYRAREPTQGTDPFGAQVPSKSDDGRQFLSSTPPGEKRLGRGHGYREGTACHSGKPAGTTFTRAAVVCTGQREPGRRGFRRSGLSVCRPASGHRGGRDWCGRNRADSTLDKRFLGTKTRASEDGTRSCPLRAVAQHSSALQAGGSSSEPQFPPLICR